MRSAAAPGRWPPWLLPALSLGAAGATYLLVILGSTVRVTESGMGCPGWPLCYGQLGPIDNFHSIMEQSHRYVVALVSVLVVLTAIAALVLVRRRRSVVVPALAAVGLIAIQIVLGAITVITHNAPVTVALHLLMGLVVLGTTWVTAVAVLAPRRTAQGRRLGALPYLAAGGTFLLLISGSLVVDGGASYACPSWPFCSAAGVAGPLVTIQYVHRAMVLLVTIVLALFAMHAARRWRDVAGARVVADLIGLLLLAQIAVGGLVATLSAPPPLQDVHLALAAAIWVLVVVLATLGWLAGADAVPATALPGVSPGLGLNMGPSPPRQEG